MPTFKARALVLRRIPLGEKDKIVTLLTREAGKLRAVAKGARGANSRLSGATEPLTVFEGLLSSGNRLDVLSQAEVRETFGSLRTDYGLVLRATYLCEVVDHLVLDRDPQPEVFDVLVAGLYLLPGARQPDFVLHAIELQLLGLLGYEPRLGACMRCDQPFGKLRPVAFFPGYGGVLCSPCTELLTDRWIPCGPGILSAIDRLSTVTDTREMLGGELSAAVLGPVHRILRAHLKARLDRELRSSAFLDAYRLEEAVDGDRLGNAS